MPDTVRGVRAEEEAKIYIFFTLILGLNEIIYDSPLYHLNHHAHSKDSGTQRLQKIQVGKLCIYKVYSHLRVEFCKVSILSSL